MGVEIESGLVALRKWVDEHPTLPKNIAPLLLRRYFHSVYYNIDKTKKLLELSFKTRNANPKLFFDRDPLAKNTQQILHSTDMLPLPIPTKDNFKVLLYRLADSQAEFNFNEAIKLFFMVADVRLVVDDQNGITDGEIPVFDMAGMSLRHLTSVVLSTLRVYMKFTQECHPVRLKHIHVLNCSPFLDRVMLLLKPFIKGETFKLIHFHLPQSNTLDAFVEPELLPNEYGGRAGSMADLKRDFCEQLMDKRDYLMDETRWRTHSAQKAGKCSSKQRMPEMCDNFQTLCID